MQTENPILPSGYSPVAPGKVATVVTCLEMREAPALRPSPETGLTVERWDKPSPQDYRDLYRTVGQQWMWVSRLIKTDDDLAATVQHPAVEVYVLTDGTRRLGLLEMDFRTEGECEIVYFGLVEEAIGGGAGRQLMNHAIETAWSHPISRPPISRLWVHTCHLDHPAAVHFYQRSGFTPYAMMVEVLDDPRLDGTVPVSASPHVPIIEPVTAK
jgi:GNAT superfamily N-acetyltransferase